MLVVGATQVSRYGKRLQDIQDRCRVVDEAVCRHDDRDAAGFLNRLGVGKPQRQPGGREVALPSPRSR